MKQNVKHYLATVFLHSSDFPVFHGVGEERKRRRLDFWWVELSVCQSKSTFSYQFKPKPVPFQLYVSPKFWGIAENVLLVSGYSFDFLKMILIVRFDVRLLISIGH